VRVRVGDRVRVRGPAGVSCIYIIMNPPLSGSIEEKVGDRVRVRI
jgi:hypothetical protein